MLHDYFLNRIAQITSICQKYKVKKLYAFGSIVDGRFVEGESDNDLLIELHPYGKKEENKTLINIWFDFQEILNCEVDLITKKSIKGKYFKKYLELYKELVFEDLNVKD